eukprot:6851621-Pyramimonas_sp.AAC.2
MPNVTAIQPCVSFPIKTGRILGPPHLEPSGSRTALLNPSAIVEYRASLQSHPPFTAAIRSKRTFQVNILGETIDQTRASK